MSEALRIYNAKLSPEELQRLERTPEKIVDRLTEALNQCLSRIGPPARHGRGLDVEGEIALGADGV